MDPDQIHLLTWVLTSLPVVKLPDWLLYGARRQARLDLSREKFAHSRLFR